MTLRVTKRGRMFAAKGFIGPRCISRPSPREYLRSRSQSRRMVREITRMRTT